MQKWNDIINSGLEHFELSVENKQIEQLKFHADEMLKWNKKTNLTSITDPFEVAVKHVVDSAAIVNRFADSSKVLDIGTGGGFPGIPLKILMPSLDVTLVETSRKKVSFLKHVVRSLKLEKINVYQARGEELFKDNKFGGKYDVVVCRAFSGIDKFVNMAVPYMKNEGVIIAMKGREAEHEKELLKKIKTETFDGQKIVYDDIKFDIFEYKLPLIVSERVLFIVKFAG